MKEEKQINTNEIINDKLEFDKDKNVNDIIKTETTQDNESPSPMNNTNNNTNSEVLNQEEVNKNEIIQENKKEEIFDKNNNNENNSSKNIQQDNIGDNLNINNELNLINESNIINTKSDLNDKSDIPNNDNSLKLKSALKGSSSKIKKIKKQIIQIFEEKIIMDKIDKLQIDNNPFNYIDNFYKFQEEYENILEEMFNDKMKKLDEIYEKYDPEINELNDYLEQEKALEEKEKEKKDNDNKDKEEEEKVPSAIQIMYDSIMEDKVAEEKQLYNDYNENVNKAKKEYFKNIDDDKSMKGGLYYNELFQNINNDILKIIKPSNKKKVNFSVTETKADKSKEEKK
jgi:hypothetical protein